MSKINFYTNKLMSQTGLQAFEAEELFQIILNGGASHSHIASIITSLKIKGESEEEIIGYINNLIEKSYVKLESDINIISLDIDNKRNFESLLLISSFIVSQAGARTVRCLNKSLYSTADPIKFISGLGIHHKKLTSDIAKLCFNDNNIAILNTNYLRNISYLTEVIQEIDMKTILTLIPSLSLPNLPKNIILLANSKSQAELFCKLLKKLSSQIRKSWIIYNDFQSLELLKDEVNYIIEVQGNNHREFTLELNRYKFSPLLELDTIFNSNSAREIIFGKRNDFYNLVILYAGLNLMLLNNLSLEESVYKAEEVLQSGSVLTLLSKLINLTNINEVEAAV